MSVCEVGVVLQGLGAGPGCAIRQLIPKLGVPTMRLGVGERCVK